MKSFPYCHCRQKIRAIFVMLASLIYLVSCQSRPNPEKIIGEWNLIANSMIKDQKGGLTIIFEPGGACTMGAPSSTATDDCTYSFIGEDMNSVELISNRNQRRSAFRIISIGKSEMKLEAAMIDGSEIRLKNELTFEKVKG